MSVNKIFKILRPEECAEFVQALVFKGSEHDLRDGFIHLSTAAQSPGTAAKHFAKDGGLWLLCIESMALGDSLRWEESRGGALFPHLYRPLTAADVVWIQPLTRGADGAYRFPEGVEWGAGEP